MTFKAAINSPPLPGINLMIHSINRTDELNKTLDFLKGFPNNGDMSMKTVWRQLALHLTSSP